MTGFNALWPLPARPVPTIRQASTSLSMWPLGRGILEWLTPSCGSTPTRTRQGGPHQRSCVPRPLPCWPIQRSSALPLPRARLWQAAGLWSCGLGWGWAWILSWGASAAGGGAACATPRRDSSSCEDLLSLNPKTYTCTEETNRAPKAKNRVPYTQRRWTPRGRTRCTPAPGRARWRPAARCCGRAWTRGQWTGAGARPCTGCALCGFEAWGLQLGCAALGRPGGCSAGKG